MNDHRDVIMTVIGDTESGKSQLVSEIFYKGSWSVTIDGRYGAPAPHYLMRSRYLNLKIWDICRAVKGDIPSPNQVAIYLKETQIICLIFKLSDKASFAKLQSWLEDYQKHNIVSGSVELFLVGTHSHEDQDLPWVNENELKALCRKYAISEERYYEVSNQTQTHLSVLKDNLINMATKLALQNTILKFRCLASSQKKPHIAHAIRCISDILLAIPAEKAAVQKYFETNEKDLMKHLNCLRWHSVSLGNTALNVVVMALAYGSVVGVLALWMSGYLAKTKAETGGYHMFFKYGEAQQAEILLHQSKLSMGV